MSQQPPDTVETNPASPAEASVIWLHGLGADAHDFEPIVPELGLEDTLPVRFVFPNAPMRPITLNAGMVMRAWYDIPGLQIDQMQDEEGIRDSQRSMEALIRREEDRGIPSPRIVVAGFSQGGAIALQTGLRHPRPLAGILALSTYVPLHTTLEAEITEAGRSSRIFMGHGAFDPIVPIFLGHASRRGLEALGCDVEWHEYPMPHSVCPEEIQHLAAWLRRVLS